MTPDPLNRLVAALAKLPGIGEKTAQRLAFHILRAPPELAAEIGLGGRKSVFDPQTPPRGAQSCHLRRV